ncbi:MAG: dihydropteroate synthase [Thermotogae bacterium]|nr:dihydropteroate synthase [Thermotogota bacterium]
MGILNITPDSFYDGSRLSGVDGALRRAERMLEEGAMLLDIGGESTRPGADPVPLEEEIRRVVPTVEAIARTFPDAVISVDTYKSEVARRSVEVGAHIINDISGGTFDPDILKVAAEYGTGIILNHIRGKPKDMQRNPHYDDAPAEVLRELMDRVARAKDFGVPDESICIDPGIGFGKRLEDNLRLIKAADRFVASGYVVLYGVSRKSFIGMALGYDDPADRLYATLGVHAYLYLKGVHVLRVHDVRETADVVGIIRHIERS